MQSKTNENKKGGAGIYIELLWEEGGGGVGGLRYTPIFTITFYVTLAY